MSSAPCRILSVLLCGFGVIGSGILDCVPAVAWRTRMGARGLGAVVRKDYLKGESSDGSAL